MTSTRSSAVTRTATTSARVREMPIAERFMGVHSETYRGQRLTVKRGKEWGTIVALINGQMVGSSFGSRNFEAVRQLDSLRGTVDHFHASPDSYINGNGDVSYDMTLTR